ncbi:MAG TPA: MarR family transcriptional regulator [Candidatus Acidoferrum sp.]|nr:MarR family transcriptional regulator [Candidatus Acidoferrum sp.]
MAKKPRPNLGEVEPWLAAWFALHPDVDREAIATVGRVIRLHPAWDRFRTPILASLGVTTEVSDLIITLYRAGRPHELNPSALAAGATVTSGAMTYRIDAAERLGLVERVADPKDRRGTIVRLTKKGKQTAQRDFELHVERMREVLDDFTAEEVATLLPLLGRLLAAIARHG